MIFCGKKSPVPGLRVFKPVLLIQIFTVSEVIVHECSNFRHRKAFVSSGQVCRRMPVQRDRMSSSNANNSLPCGCMIFRCFNNSHLCGQQAEKIYTSDTGTRNDLDKIYGFHLPADVLGSVMTVECSIRCQNLAR